MALIRLLQNKLSAAQSAEEREAELQASAGIVFENYLASVIFSALVIFGFIFLYGVATDILHGSAGFRRVAISLLDAFVAAALTFLVGFLAGIVLVVPLYRRTISKDRNFKSLFGVCVVATCVAIILMLSAMNKGQMPNIPSLITVFLSAILISVSFLKRISSLSKYDRGRRNSQNLKKFN